MDQFGKVFEQFKVAGKDLADKIQQLIHEGNVRRIIVKDERGHTFIEIPLTVATIGVVAAPVLAAVGAVATYFSKFHIVVERTGPEAADPPSGSATTDSSVGATEENVDMKDTVPEHVDNRGTKVEDIAGNGKPDAMGG